MLSRKDENFSLSNRSELTVFNAIDIMNHRHSAMMKQQAWGYRHDPTGIQVLTW